ncbi:hypothetical protein MHYP_G00350340 [Metynnis hypsauchen]
MEDAVLRFSSCSFLSVSLVHDYKHVQRVPPTERTDQWRNEISAAAERSEKQKQLVENQRKFQQRIQQTENKLQELRQAMETIRVNTLTRREDTSWLLKERISIRLKTS